MVFWILFSLWIVGVILPLGVKLWEPQLQWRWILIWEALMFSPFILGFGLLVGLFLLGRGIKVKDKEKIRNFYIPKMPR